MTEKTKFNDHKLMKQYLLEITKDDLQNLEYSKEFPNVEMITSWGGEGQGDDTGYIIRITEGSESVLVKVEGSYNSYEGSDYSYADVYLVEPREVMVTQYFKING